MMTLTEAAQLLLDRLPPDVVALRPEHLGLLLGRAAEIHAERHNPNVKPLLRVRGYRLDGPSAEGRNEELSELRIGTRPCNRKNLYQQKYPDLLDRLTAWRREHPEARRIDAYHAMEAVYGKRFLTTTPFARYWDQTAPPTRGQDAA